MFVSYILTCVCHLAYLYLLT